MVTPESLLLEAAKLDAYLEAFEHTYLTFLEIGKDDLRQRERGVYAFYEIKDKVESLIQQMKELSGHMEVCDAIRASDQVRKTHQ